MISAASVFTVLVVTAVIVAVVVGPMLKNDPDSPPVGDDLVAGNWTLLEAGSPGYAADGLVVEGVSGRVVVVSGDIPTLEARRRFARSSGFSQEESTAIEDESNWFVESGSAVCVLAGSAVLNGRRVGDPKAEDPVFPGRASVLCGGRTELWSRARHKDNQKASFSFRYGVRDDPTMAVTGGNWDLRFGASGWEMQDENGRSIARSPTRTGAENESIFFDTNLVTGDHGSIVDLGEIGLSEIRSLPALDTGWLWRAKVVERHSYLVVAADQEGEFWAVFEVTNLDEQEDKCTLDWVVVRPEGELGLSLDAPTRERLAGLLEAAPKNVARGSQLKSGSVEIKFVTNGAAIRGSKLIAPLTCRAVGFTKLIVDSPALDGPAGDSGPSLLYTTGGYVPAGKVFVVSRVTWKFTASQDPANKADNYFAVVFNRSRLAYDPAPDGEVEGEWTGSVEVRRGQEHLFYASLPKPAWGRVLIEGELRDE